MSTFTIGEVAERTGFTASALRYYEGIGLVEPASRTDAGYRLYDESTLARMAFIARAKRLGCTLEEITDLVAIWDDDQCGPVQRRLHDLVTEKIGATQQQLDELTAFADQLRTAATHLSGAPVDGACDEGCACLTEPVAGGAVPVALGVKPGDVPIACTLDGASMPDRVDEWRAVLAHSTSRTAADDGALRLAMGPDTPTDELMRLVAAEQTCCAFFSFAITVDGRGLALEVRAPEGADTIVASLFGEAA
jgi:MerR family copper efflux transcriptional regulator